MYRQDNSTQLEFADFYMPFSGKLDPDNRWVKLAQLVPWQLAQGIYAATLCDDFGAPALSARLALGALIIKERQGLTDRETVQAIQENPYMQFFVGLEEFTQEPAFDASLMVDFRKRFGEVGLSKLSEAVALEQLGTAGSEPAPRDEIESSLQPSESNENQSSQNASNENASIQNTPSPGPGANNSNHSSSDESTTTDPKVATTQEPTTQEPSVCTESDSPESDNSGKLILDATCAPADIRYPTDVSLLNEARERTEEIIDILHDPLVGKLHRPRTYRVRAARQFKAFVRKKKPRKGVVRKMIRKQLGYLLRNLQSIAILLENPEAGSLEDLPPALYKRLLVCHEVYRQQQQMYDSKTRRVDDRIVSLSQPHVRPIKRGKAGRDTEFGAKLSASVVEGFLFLDHLRWDSFNESCDFVDQVETYRQRFGCYPESVHADQIYRTRSNRSYCQDRGIRLSGPPLGRRPQEVSSETKQQRRADEAIRNHIEGKFGQGKRRFGLDRVMAKLSSTSAAQISLSFLVMNLEAALVRLFLALIFLLSAHPVGAASSQRVVVAN